MTSSIQTPHAWLTSDYGTYTFLNTLTDAIGQLQGSAPAGGQGALDFFSATQVTAQTALASGTWTAATFDTTSEIIDSASGHSTTVNNSRYTCAQAGIVEVGGVGAFASSASGTRRLVCIRKNGVDVPGSYAGGPPISASNMGVAVPSGVLVSVVAGDYLELFLNADYASWATVVSSPANCRLSVRWVHV